MIKDFKEFIRFSKDNLVARFSIVFVLMIPSLLVIEQILEYLFTNRPQVRIIGQLSLFYFMAVLVSFILAWLVGKIIGSSSSYEDYEDEYDDKYNY